MRAYYLIESLQDFEMTIGFWAGAHQVWLELMDDDDKMEAAEQLFQDYFESNGDDDFASITTINDWVWFDLPDLLEKDYDD